MVGARVAVIAATVGVGPIATPMMGGVMAVVGSP